MCVVCVLFVLLLVLNLLCVLLVRDGRGFGDEACFRVSRPADGVDGVEGRSVIELCHGAFGLAIFLVSYGR